MMEYFAFKKVKKHQAEKKAAVLTQEDENFLERIVSAEGTPPPLPERPHGLGPEAGDPTGNAAQMVVHDGNTTAVETETEKEPVDKKGKGKANEVDKEEKKKSNRFSFLSRSGTKKVRDSVFKTCPLPQHMLRQPRTKMVSNLTLTS